MALPLFAALNKLARTALPLIRGGVTKGMASRAISDTLKTTFGKSISRNTLLKIIRQYKSIDALGAQLKFLPKLARPNPLRIPAAITKLRRTYAFIVKVRGILEGTEVHIDQQITVSSNELLTRAQIETLAAEAIDRNQEKYKLIIEQVTLTNAFQAGPLGLLA